MFFIVNTTKQSLSISDLKLILGPRQGIDLDVKHIREVSEKSKGLKSLISKGLITVKNKTEPEVKSHFVQEVHNHNSNFDAEKMKADIMNGLKDVIAESLPQQLQQPQQPQQSAPQPNIDMKALAKMIASMMPQGQPVIQKEIFVPQDEEVKVDEGVLADIHSRAASKIVKGAESGEANFNIEKTNNDIDDNIDELENLLG
jgi:hypothetical protein